MACWRRRNGHLPSEGVGAFFYHVPFCRMAKKAHRQVRRCDLEDRAGQALNARTARRQRGEGVRAELRAAGGGSGLTLCAEIGNCYTASLYLGLTGSSSTKTAAALAGKRIGLFSYGSGCCGRVLLRRGRRGRGAGGSPEGAGIDAILGERGAIDIAEYERIMALAPERPPEIPPAPGGFRFTGMHEHRRQYAAG